MRQVLHIFKKDVRYLRFEIGLYLLLLARFAWTETRSTGVEMIVLAACAYLIARVIHAEAIPGTRQFWLTRPYRWTSLLAAKLLFIVVVVNVPIFIAQLLILVRLGFPVAPNLAGALWSQFLLMQSLVPFAALAGVTSGLVWFVLASLTVVAYADGLELMLARTVYPVWPMPVEWIRGAIMAAAILVIASLILAIQYKSRRTIVSRTLVISSAVIAPLMFWYIPVSLELPAQTRFSKQPSESVPIQVRLDPSLKKSVRMPVVAPPGGSEVIQLDLPLVLTGIPSDGEIRVDAIGVDLQAADGQKREFPLTGVNDGRVLANVFEASVFVDSAFFNAARQQPVTVRASAYLTIFGNSEERTFRLGQTPINIEPGLQAYARGENLRFRLAFHQPKKLIYARIGTFMDSVGQWVSYSPFPADGTLSPVWETAFGPPLSGPEVNVISKEPLAHFRRDVELRDARLEDFAVAN